MVIMLASTPTAAQLSRGYWPSRCTRLYVGGGRSIRLGAERAIDPRHRSLTNIKCEQRRRSHQSAPDIPRMKRRAALLNTSVFFSVLSAIGTSLLVIVAFISAFLQVPHEHGVAVLFIVSLGLFIVSLGYLALETQIRNP